MMESIVFSYEQKQRNVVFKCAFCRFVFAVFLLPKNLHIWFSFAVILLFVRKNACSGRRNRGRSFFCAIVTISPAAAILLLLPVIRIFYTLRTFRFSFLFPFRTIFFFHRCSFTVPVRNALPYKKFGAQTALSSLRFMRLPK